MVFLWFFVVSSLLDFGMVFDAETRGGQKILIIRKTKKFEKLIKVGLVDQFSANQK